MYTLSEQEQSCSDACGPDVCAAVPEYQETDWAITSSQEMSQLASTFGYSCNGGTDSFGGVAFIHVESDNVDSCFHSHDPDSWSLDCGYTRSKARLL